MTLRRMHGSDGGRRQRDSQCDTQKVTALPSSGGPGARCGLFHGATNGDPKGVNRLNATPAGGAGMRDAGSNSSVALGSDDLGCIRPGGVAGGAREREGEGKAAGRCTGSSLWGVLVECRVAALSVGASCCVLRPSE